MKNHTAEKINVFHNSVFTALSIGIPFCIFKFLFGLLVIRHHLDIAGWLLVIWSIIDLIMNSTTVLLIIFKLKPAIETCMIAQAGRLFRKPELFITFDTFISFSIICFTLWSGWIKEFSLSEHYLWLLATTINLISLSIANIWMELQKSRIW
jgi:hypothetical protein